jgi:4-cresol dehydrogenase (hydroxylating) cytochrome subunit
MRMVMAILCFTTLSIASASETPQQEAVPGQWRSGAEAFDKVCGRCHLSGVGPELRGRGLPATYIKVMARNGRNGMPAFSDSALDDTTLEAVARLISTSKQPNPR